MSNETPVLDRWTKKGRDVTGSRTDHTGVGESSDRPPTRVMKWVRSDEATDGEVN